MSRPSRLSNFAATLKAHLAGVALGKPVEIWFKTRPESARRTGSSGSGRDRGAGAALRRHRGHAVPPRRDLPHRRQGRSRILLLDRAGWHTTGNLFVPRNMTLVFLPSRAPELNPVENVWR